MPSITIQCNACDVTMENYRPPKSGIQQDDLEALMAQKGIPIDPAEVDWNCGCGAEGKPRQLATFPNYTPVEE